jgi:2,5-diketo-D-gluconate reductase A
MSQVPTVKLNDGAEMPTLGFGVYKIPDSEVREAVHTAIEAGYRSIDTATLYRNERGVGDALASSGVDRRELFVTTKLWNTDHGYDNALRAFDTSLRELRMDYVDLYLIHWPVPSADRYVETWRALERIRGEGRARSIGVSNFQVPHLSRLLDETDTVPAVNQIELHPWLQQAELRDFHARHGIVTEAWSPLARGGKLLRDPVLGRLAAKHGTTPAQVVLAWQLALGNVVIPKSVTPARIRENIDVFDLELDAEDMKAIAALDGGTRVGANPDTVGS